MKLLTQTATLTIVLEGIEQFFGLRHQLSLPRDQISQLQWQPEAPITGPVIRTAGTAAPRLLLAGHYRGHGKRYFLYVKHPRGFYTKLRAENILRIDLTDNHYETIWVSCSAEDGMRLVKWWQDSASSASPTDQ